MKASAGPRTTAVANREIPAEFAGANDQIASGRSELRFVDSSVSAILGNLRPGVEAIVLDSTRPAARQIAVLDSRHGLCSVHFITYCAPDRVRVTAGDSSSEILEDSPEDFAAIGCALDADSELDFRSCRAGAGAERANLIADQALATGAAGNALSRAGRHATTQGDF